MGDSWKILIGSIFVLLVLSLFGYFIVDAFVSTQQQQDIQNTQGFVGNFFSFLRGDISIIDIDIPFVGDVNVTMDTITPFQSNEYLADNFIYLSVYPLWFIIPVLILCLSGIVYSIIDLVLP